MQELEREALQENAGWWTSSVPTSATCTSQLLDHLHGPMPLTFCLPTRSTQAIAAGSRELGGGPHVHECKDLLDFAEQYDLDIPWAQACPGVLHVSRFTGCIFFVSAWLQYTSATCRSSANLWHQVLQQARQTCSEIFTFPQNPTRRHPPCYPLVPVALREGSKLKLAMLALLVELA